MNNALTTRQSAALEMAPQTWQLMKDQAAMLVQSGFLPNSIRKPEQAIAIMLKGRELGVPAMQAFGQINVIQGKPTISAELMLALIYRDCPGAKVEYTKYEIDGCHIKATRPGHKPATFKFERGDAEAAGLLGKDNWRKYPRAMYRSRCISEMARSVFPDCLMGCSYTPEEINPDVRVDEDGVVVDVQVEPEIKAEPENREPEPPKQESGPNVYTGTTEQQRLIQGVLKAKNVPEDLWPEIDKRLRGKRAATELKAIIDGVMGNVNGSAQENRPQA